MRKTFLLAALAAPLFAGGFFLQLGNPEANPEARRLNAVLVIQAAGCHDPATAKVTATATGIVIGFTAESVRVNLCRGMKMLRRLL